jgi:multifunctional methyltransferase subunit TRM112
MRLITHNLLTCNKKGVETGFPLRIEPETVEVVESEFNAEFMRKMVTKLDWAAFLAGAEALKVADGLPRALPSEGQDPPLDEQTLRKVHHALMDVHVKQGKLICPESGREFPIVDGIPNMLLNEDEV